MVLSAGAREVFLVENVIATAIGARMPIQDPSGNMVVDIGGGVTEITVISLSGVVAAKSVRIAGTELDLDIINFVRNEYGLLIGELVAEDIKKKAGRVDSNSGKSFEMKVRGRDMLTGLPREISLTSNQIRDALDRSITTIIDGIKSTLEITPPELVADIYQRGLVLAGGGSLLANIDKDIAHATKIPVKIVDDPVTCAVRGMGIILEDDQLLRGVAVPSTNEERGKTF